MAISAHPDWQAIPYGAAAVVAGDLRPVDLLTPAGTLLLVLTVWLNFTCVAKIRKIHHC